MALKLREATIHDAPDIGRIHVETWQSAYEGIVPKSYLDELSIDKRTSKWTEMLEINTDGTIIAEIDFKPVGWVSFGIARDEDVENTGEIYAIYVDPTHWNRGIGRLLMRAAEEKLQFENISTIVLWVLEANINSRSFYSILGYAEDGSIKEIAFSGKTLIELRYKKQCEAKNHDS